MKIITLTLNPAFDIHCYTDDFKPFSENLANITSYEAGGKGVNISCTLTANGIPNTAYIVVGDENKEGFLKRLNVDNINYKEFVVSGAIRENITLHTKDKPETRISFAGFDADENVINNIKEELEKETKEDLIVTLTGRIANGMDIEKVKKLLLGLKEKGAKIVIDSKSFSKKDISDVKPYLIKPNEEEISMYTDIEVVDFFSAKEAAQKIKDDGVENVLISLGSKGAVLCSEDGTFCAQAPKIEVLSTIGAGDSSVAGFAESILTGQSYADALKNAIAYGSAACMCEGTKPPTKKDIEELYKRIKVSKI